MASHLHDTRKFESAQYRSSRLMRRSDDSRPTSSEIKSAKHHEYNPIRREKHSCRPGLFSGVFIEPKLKKELRAMVRAKRLCAYLRRNHARPFRSTARSRFTTATSRFAAVTCAGGGGSGNGDDGGGSGGSDSDLPKPGIGRATFHSFPKQNKPKYLNYRLAGRSWRFVVGGCC